MANVQTKRRRRGRESPTYFLREFDPDVKTRIQTRARARGLKPGQMVAAVWEFYEACFAGEVSDVQAELAKRGLAPMEV